MGGQPAQRPGYCRDMKANSAQLKPEFWLSLAMNK
jgi:hypothetical protein